jgi:hypothetical protein
MYVSLRYWSLTGSSSPSPFVLRHSVIIITSATPTKLHCTDHRSLSLDFQRGSACLQAHYHHSSLLLSSHSTFLSPEKWVLRWVKTVGGLWNLTNFSKKFQKYWLFILRNFTYLHSKFSFSLKQDSLVLQNISRLKVSYFYSLVNVILSSMCACVEY